MFVCNKRCQRDHKNNKNMERLYCGSLKRTPKWAPSVWPIPEHIKKGGLDTRSYLMPVPHVWACPYVDMHAHFRYCTGPSLALLLQETHVLSWQGEGVQTELNSCTKETKKKRGCCHPSSEARLGVIGCFFCLSEGEESSRGSCSLNGECGCFWKASSVRESLFQRTMSRAKSRVGCAAAIINFTFLSTLCVCVLLF